MTKLFYLILLILLLAGWLYVYKIHRIPTEIKYTDITSDQLKTMLQNKDFYFVNVHIPYEGEIEKTDAFIPYDEIENNLNKKFYRQASESERNCNRARVKKNKPDG